MRGMRRKLTRLLVGRTMHKDKINPCQETLMKMPSCGTPMPSIQAVQAELDAQRLRHCLSRWAGRH